MRLVVIGGTAAGLSAASRVRKFKPDSEIVVIERTGFVSYGSCGLPYFVSGMIENANDLVSLTVDDLKTKRDIHVLIRHEAISINRSERTVTVKRLVDDEVFDIDYDALVIATGARAVVPKALSTSASNVFTLRSVEDGIAIRNQLGHAQRAIIIGGGFIGLEMADAFSRKNVAVSVFEMAERLLPDMDPAFSEMMKKELEKNGVEIHLGTSVDAIITKDGKAKGVLAEGKEYSTDSILICVGVVPNSEIAMQAGLNIEQSGAIYVDRYQQTSDSYIWACGDCACTLNRITEKPCYAPLGTNANKQGRIAGLNICGKEIEFPGVLPSQVTKVFDLCIATTGLTLSQANKYFANVGQTIIEKRDRASYYPDGTISTICLVYDKKTGRVLGGQGAGGDSIAGRINVLATAITAGMTVNDLSELDLVYAPPVAPVYDPILIAGECAEKNIIH